MVPVAMESISWLHIRSVCSSWHLFSDSKERTKLQNIAVKNQSLSIPSHFFLFVYIHPAMWTFKLCQSKGFYIVATGQWFGIKWDMKT